MATRKELDDLIAAQNTRLDKAIALIPAEPAATKVATKSAEERTVEEETDRKYRLELEINGIANALNDPKQAVPLIVGVFNEDLRADLTRIFDEKGYVLEYMAGGTVVRRKGS